MRPTPMRHADGTVPISVPTEYISTYHTLTIRLGNRVCILPASALVNERYVEASTMQSYYTPY